MPVNLSQFVTGTFNSASSGNVLFSSAVSSLSLIVAHIANFFTGVATFTNVIDNVNANAYTVGCQSTMASDTIVHGYIAYKAGISSGAAASTYRVSVNFSAANNWSMGAVEYTGGAWTVGSTKSANGTSSSPSPGAVTASSTPVLIVMNAMYNSAGTLFNSTINTGAWRVTVDAGNVNQVLAIADSTNSSLTQSPTFGLTTSTRWLTNAMIFMGLGSGGAAAVRNPFTFTLTGVV
jgi:hypothetical protein